MNKLYLVKLILMTYMDSVAPDEPAHLQLHCQYMSRDHLFGTPQIEFKANLQYCLHMYVPTENRLLLTRLKVQPKYSRRGIIYCQAVPES